MKRYSVIVESDKGVYDRVLKGEEFDDYNQAIKWANSNFHAAYSVTDNTTRKVVASRGEFRLIEI